MKIFCIGSIAISILLMFYNAFMFGRLTLACKKSAYLNREKRVFLYMVCFVTLVIFLLSYVGYLFVLLHVGAAGFMSAFSCVMSFLGSLLVFVMVRLHEENHRSLNKKIYELMSVLVAVIEMKDPYTRGHSTHVYNIVKMFYNELPASYKNKIDKSKLFDAALLHDIGKVSVPDAVLNKETKLTDDEYNIIKTHAINGKKLLDKTSLKELGNWVAYHHERMDGKGYYKIKGSQIPLESKIIALADVYSALVTNRIYRKKFDLDKALEIIKSESGDHFDPELAKIFYNISRKKFEKLNKEYEDNEFSDDKIHFVSGKELE